MAGNPNGQESKLPGIQMTTYPNDQVSKWPGGNIRMASVSEWPGMPNGQGIQMARSPTASGPVTSNPMRKPMEKGSFGGRSLGGKISLDEDFLSDIGGKIPPSAKGNLDGSAVKSRFLKAANKRSL